MPVRYEVEEAVALITLDRPDVLNAFDDELGIEALDAVKRASVDPDVRCIVLTGEGRAFSSGEDLGALADTYESGQAPDLGQTLINRYNPLIRAIRTAPKPVLAAVNGVAAGAGASLVLACDFKVASEKAKLVLAFIKVGLIPDSGALWFLTKALGAAKAFELGATGDPIDAQQALAWGLVTRVVAADEFDDEWRAFAQELAVGPTRAFALTKELVNSATERSLYDQLEAEVHAQTEAGKTDDHLEGVQAFLGKRAPKFEGR
jgi:2-(1,2-epoxy-1,2-dihydrophenyl)acetyl-CoA isomerase